MFTPWIKRKSLKKTSKSRNLVVDGERPSLIMLLSLSALLVLVGVFVVQRGMAATWWNAQSDPAESSGAAPPSATPTPTPTPSATPSMTPTPAPTQGPSRRTMY
jgi:cytoskeletal protein RodZ